MGWYVGLVVLVGLERLAELVVTKRNVAWSLAQGGHVLGRSHYPYMVVLHLSLLIACIVEVSVADRTFTPALGWSMLGLVIAAQALRWWCIATLGRQWTTGIVVVPGLSRVRSGPYRFLNHPNYVAVVIEGFALPMVHSAWVTAAAFTMLNAPLMVVRIRVENTALAELA